MLSRKHKYLDEVTYHMNNIYMSQLVIYKEKILPRFDGSALINYCYNLFNMVWSLRGTLKNNDIIALHFKWRIAHYILVWYLFCKYHISHPWLSIAMFFTIYKNHYYLLKIFWLANSWRWNRHICSIVAQIWSGLSLHRGILKTNIRH